MNPNQKIVNKHHFSLNKFQGTFEGSGECDKSFARGAVGGFFRGIGTCSELVDLIGCTSALAILDIVTELRLTLW